MVSDTMAIVRGSGDARGPSGTFIGSRPGHIVAGILVASALLLLMATVVGSTPSFAGEYLALRFLEHYGWVSALAVSAATLIVTAAILVTPRRPAATILRVLSVLVWLLIAVAGFLWGGLIDSFAPRRISTHVVAVSPDNRFEVVYQVEEEKATGARDDLLRLRSRAGLLSRESPWDPGICVGVGADVVSRIHVEFLDNHTIRFVTPNGVATTVTFNPNTLKPDRLVDVCPPS
jgi:hypothetical protein